MIVKSKSKALLAEAQYKGKVNSAKARPNEAEPKKYILGWKLPGLERELEKEYPPSFEPGTPLRKDVETLLRRQFTQREAEEGFDLNNVVGLESHIAVMHVAGAGGRIREVVGLVLPVEAPSTLGK